MEETNAVLEGIKRKIREVVRLMSNNIWNKDRCLLKIDESLSRLDSVRRVADAHHVRVIDESLRALRAEVDAAEDSADGAGSAQFSYAAERPLSGSRGRPPVNINTEQLALMQKSGLTAVQMADHLGCSASLMYKKLADANLLMRDKYADISDQQLDERVRDLHNRHRNAGTEMMSGYLRASGLVVQRNRVRWSLNRIDPLGSACRWGRAVTRRTYSVPTPNSLWHLDSHMKLVRWGFVTHGCVDGYSRVITFLQTATTNEAKVVLNLFTEACTAFGLPSRVRCDRGGENMDVAIFMTMLRGNDRGSCIAGRSVHNQRIERLWRDVANQVTSHFYSFFYSLEDEGLLDIDNDVHLHVLQLVFLPVINTRMNEFRTGWNSHRLRTENNSSPQQLWLDGMLWNANSQYVATAELFNQPVTLGTRVQDALDNFNINLESFRDDQSGPQTPRVQCTVHATTAARIQAAVADIVNWREMFQTAVQMCEVDVD